MNGLVMGRIVYYVFDSFNADGVVKRRKAVVVSVPPAHTPEPVPTHKSTTPIDKTKDTKDTKDHSQTLETQAIVGNEVREGGIFPAVVTKVAADHVDQGVVNLKVMLDGPDEAWVQNVYFNSERKNGTWHWPSIS